MDQSNYEQFTLRTETLGDATGFLTDGLEVRSLLYNGQVLTVELPVTVELRVIDTAPAIFLLVPIFAPVAKGYGIDLIHFGIIVTVNLCIGLLTPPVGSCIFIGSSLAKISIEELLKPLWPFLIAEIVILMLITYVTPLVMWLPRTLGY
jgi:TRAP-type C4-dicarboxylate transport system permease large subunit